jgi:electron transport complex protein RnfE
MALGAVREFLGQGTLFHQADLMLGEAAKGLSMSLGPDFQGALLAILPPGAFIGLGMLIALKNLVDKRVEQQRAARIASAGEPRTAG